MKGFVLGCGHSGTTWAAEALAHSTDLLCRHEWMGKHLKAGYNGVESNGNLYKMTAEIKERWPGIGVVHIVRDGRLVVRTIMYRKPADFFEPACRRWTGRNHLLGLDICANHRFRLEDLTTEFHTFRTFALRLGAKRVDARKWEEIRSRKINASHSQLVRRWPPYAEWEDEHKDLFWEMCGDMMTVMGYRR